DDLTRHAIAAPFWAFMTSSGRVWDGERLVHDRLFENPYYATGRPISEAYWTTVHVGGTQRDVLLQCFERRCLAYTPENPAGWQVEAGNVAQHYFSWRYQSGHDYAAVWLDGEAAATVGHGAAAITIPAGSLSGPAIVSIAPATTGQPFPGFLAVGSGWQVEMSGADLVAPVSLSFAVDPARLPAGSEASEVQVAFFDEMAGHWTLLPTVLDHAASRASVTTNHLSLWQLFVATGANGGDPPGADPPDTDPPDSIPPTPTPTPNAAPEVDLNGPDAAGRDGTAAMQAGGDPIVVAPLAQVIDPDDDILFSIVVELLDAPDGINERLSAVAAPSVAVSTDSDGRRLQLGGPAARSALQQVLRTVRYHHDGGDDATAGDRRVAVRAADDAGPGPVAYVTVGVTPAPANRAPEASDVTVTTDEDVPVRIALAATDPDDDDLTWSLVTTPQHGALSGTAPDLVYTPSADYHGADAFTWSATDPRGASTTAMVSIAVAPVNDPPVAHAASFETDEDVAVPITLSGSDVDGDTLTFEVASAPEHGTLSGDAPLLVYTPDTDFSGDDSFGFAVSDGAATSGTATVAITVRAVNDPPTAGGQQVTTDEDVPVAIILDETDIDSEVTFTIVDEPLHGDLTGEAPVLTYTPDPNFKGSDSFTYTAGDGEHVSDPATVSIVVNPVNDPPVASSQSITLLEDGAQFLTITGSDIDGDIVRFTITRSPVLGNVSVDGDWRCVPDSMPRVCSHVIHYGTLADVNGADSFEFTVNDGEATSPPAVVTITILPVNDPPIARDDSAVTDEDASDVTIDVLANDSTAPDVGETLTIASVESFSNGGSAVVSGGALFYPPAPDFYGTETFRYTISDGNGGEASATVTVSVAGVNDPPTAADDVFVLDEDSGPTPLDLLANDSIVPDRDDQ
ncbi:MAG TPA: Ig-like domain-containing protein, partial [Thermomicrobiales bacterium]|nr:Ig-like domain-containing protein [Thermomicrobiales bacterium]